ncbi:MAG TPA: hypothetical protein VHT28_06455 [Silvibacterium sp.]|nr:hypothetical protein [Silvibacterium sp.]
MPKRLSPYIAFALPPLLLLAAGCGTGQYAGVSANSGVFSITPSSSAINSNGQVKFTALLPTGEPAAVNWSIAEGENASSLGEGHIDANGTYTPPGALSRNSVQIHILAHLESDPSATAAAVINVTPGFVQSLLPENAALTVGGTLEVTAEIAEVNAGSVKWSLSESPAGNASPSGNDNTMNLGTLDHITCQRSLDQFTTCKVSYTAPATLSVASTVYVSAAVNGTTATSPLRILLNTDGLNSTPSTNQAAQTGTIALGTSGGNDNDYDTWQDRSGTPYIADCCGGTLGALVEDTARNQYILSNNHVLAESDQAKIGDTIDEPGLIDNGCVPLSHAGSTLRPVGSLKYYVPLATTQSNVDAALASAFSGAVDPTGSILQLDAPKSSATGGHPNSSLEAAPPMAGTGEPLNANNLGSIELAKSSRTTGLTCSTVESVDLSVRVDYFKDCAETQPYYTKTFTGQIGIAGDNFADSGDSGALVVDSSNAQPVGLFFAGGTDGDGSGLSVANPISDVLRELAAQAGSRLNIVGTTTPHKVACIRYDTTPRTTVPAAVSSEVMARAQSVAESTGASLVNPEMGILATAAGKSLDSPGEAALIVYADKSKPRVDVPQTFDGLRTQLISIDAAALARGLAPAAPPAVSGIHLSDSTLAGATAVVREYGPRLLADTAIFGVGVSQSQDNPAEPSLLVLVDLNRTPASMPATLGGLRVRYMKLHRFHVTQSKYSGANHASSCALKGLTPSGTPRSARDGFAFEEKPGVQ